MKLLGRGYSGEVFEYDDNKAVKLYYRGYSEKAIMKEYQNSLIAQRLGIPAPHIFDLVTMEDRKGLVMDKLVGCSLLDMAYHGKDISDKLVNMAKIQKDMNEKTCDELRDYRDFIKGEVAHDEAICALVDLLPAGNNVCHGDFHPGNLWVNPDGSLIVIDFMNLVKGPKEYDVALSYYIIKKAKLPADTPNYDLILKWCEDLANQYLSLMGYQKEELATYLKVIELFREYKKA